MSQLSPPELPVDPALARLAGPPDIPGIVRYYQENHRHLWRWQPIIPDALDEGWWLAQLHAQRRSFKERAECRLYLFVGDEVVGRVSLFGVVRGAAHSAWVSYELAAAWTGRGLGTRAVEGLLDYAGRELALHRIQAQVHPENERSTRLLERLGFHRVGVLRSALFLHGEWVDQVLHERQLEGWTPPEGHFRLGPSGIEPI